MALFAAVVLAGWLPLITVAALSGSGPLHGSIALGAEVALASAFAFAAFTLVLLVTDHAALVESAVTTERRRLNLSRFFAPGVVAELEAKGETPALERRDASVMFVDLRSFSRFSEQVTARVFAHGGTVDKFIGDGVMAVFGHPRAAPDDAERALRCAEEVAADLELWSERRRARGQYPLTAGIGLHHGMVVAGVLASGGHYEFSVFGDAVNVAERLERLSKVLNASVVISSDVRERLANPSAHLGWLKGLSLDLEGRTGRIDVSYIPRSEHGTWSPSSMAQTYSEPERERGSESHA